MSYDMQRDNLIVWSICVANRYQYRMSRGCGYLQKGGLIGVITVM